MYRTTGSNASAFYAIALSDIEHCRHLIEQALGVQLEGRSGMAYGEYYRHTPRDSDLRVFLVENFYDWEDDVRAAGYEEYPLRLEVFTNGDLRAIEEKLEAIPELGLTFMESLNHPPDAYEDEELDDD